MINFKTITAAAMAAVFFQAYTPAFAQVEVVDLGVKSTRYPSDQGGSQTYGDAQGDYSRTGKPSPASMTEFYFQLQTLQQEVQTLRGIIEEQSFELKKLKQQRLDDYLDLDRRLSALTQSDNDGSAPRANTAAPSQSVAQAVTATNPEDELALYREGIDAVLKHRDYEKGITAFETYLQDYPSGVYVANAKYWLGQVYLQQDELDSAQKWFNELVAEFPDHQKAPEATFKIAKILYLQGDTAKAQAQLNAVAKSGTPAAKLAQDFLDKHF